MDEPASTRACRGCGVHTEGWGGTPGVYTDPGYNQYPLCMECGGKCCGDCGPDPCEFGIAGGGPAASVPWIDEETKAWQESRFMRMLDWLDAHTPGHFPWGMIWLKAGFSFHFASGIGGFFFGFPLPRWLPGFVRSYQTDGPKRFWQRCSWASESNLRVIVPLLPPGLPSAYRTRRMRRRKHAS